MKIHYLQHVPFEDLANIEIWAREKNYSISRTLLYLDEELPELDNLDWLVVMGGPMNIYQEKDYPWLKKEKRFIEAAISKRKTVLGICLGAQLIADVLGAKVKKNSYKEIGWFNVTLTKEAKSSSIFENFPDDFVALHWHGDTFDIPDSCVRIAESEACTNQAFQYDDRVIGLQFHLESSLESIGKLIQNCGDELIEGKYIQKSDEILSKIQNIDDIYKNMRILLKSFEGKSLWDKTTPRNTKK